jgi:7,8-dihydropterin-6-yl-methyl-4-(beta-D-ribofuranosyl)aminobenzene 5'-phosphate synthase
MKIKVIATGSSKWERFIRRWGISFLIGEDVLFDTFGDARVFMKNVRKFNIDLSKIKHIVLSHDDWDHVTGLWEILPGRNDITVYICPGFHQEIKDKITSFGVKIVEACEMVNIKDRIYSTGEMYGETKGRKIYEQSIVIKMDKGLTLMCGCAHPRVEKIVREVKERFHDDVYYLIGGFHLKDNTDDENIAIIKELQQHGVRKIAPMHCTGWRASNMMHRIFKYGYLCLKEGMEVEV